MRKRVLLGLTIAFFVMFSGLVLSASSDYSDEINAAFNCLDDRVASTSLSLEEAVFAALADAPNVKINDTINQMKSSSNFCWSTSGCKVKETAQVALAKLSMGEDIGNITDWLKTKTGVAEDLTWYLQITTGGNVPATCTINYDGSDHDVDINEDMTVSGSPGSCFTVSSSGYWFRISSSCLTKTFNVQCSEGDFSEFKTNLLYQKGTGGVTYLSPDTHSASKGAWTEEVIMAKCFKEGSACDYEASLWAATALYANAESIDEFAPYLRAMASSNEKYFPSAFLMAMLEGGEEHYSNIIDSKRLRPEGAYWEMVSSPYGKYYDTSLAMLAFGGADSAEIESSNTLEYLFTHQDDTGCWNSGNIRDTAFVIYAAKWLRGDWIGPVCGDGAKNGGEACDGNDFGGATCESIGQIGGNLSCTDECTYNVGECIAGGESICGDGIVNGSEICDGSNLDDETCVSQGYDGGDLSCASNCLTFDVDDCEGEGGPPLGPGGNNTNGTDGGGSYNPNLVTDCELAGLFCASSMSSCLEAGGSYYPQSTHSCESHLEFCCTVEVPEQNCASLGGQVCRWDEQCSGEILQASDGACCLDFCESTGVDEVCESDSDCASGEYCNSYGECVASNSGSGSGGSSDEEGGSLWTWIIILAILILIVVIGIVFRDKLKAWWFKVSKKGGGPKGSKPGVPPRTPPGLIGRRPMPNFGPRRPPVQPQRRPSPRPPIRGGGKGKEEDDTFKKLKEMSK